MSSRKNGMLMFVAALALLAGCGGGSGGGSNGPGGSNPPPVVNADPGGVWFGTAENTSVGETFDVIGVSIGTGEFRFIDTRGAQYSGSMQVSGNTYTASFKAIAPLGEEFINGSTVINGSLNGTINQRNSMSGQYTMSTGEKGTLSLAYDPIYQRTSSLTNTTGVWQGLFGDVFNIDSNGQLFGQDATGCVFSGQVSLISSQFNAYRLNVNIANCDIFNGNYSGLGVLADLYADGDNRGLIIQVNSSAWSITDLLEKL